MTIAEAFKKNIDRLDTERLLLHVLDKKESSWLYAHSEEALTSDQEKQFLDAVTKRKKGIPLAYILGFSEFYGRRFKVTPDVLIPRPETEELVTAAIEAIQALYGQLQRPLRVIDVGTGSGCIAITLSLECAEMLETTYATDTSEAALAVARSNASINNAQKVTFMPGDLLASVDPAEVDLIISNPPYVASTEVDAAYHSPTPETIGLQFEPRQALDGGADGQDIINRLIKLNRPLLLEATGGVIQKFNF